jgi:hypothetical protein
MTPQQTVAQYLKDRDEALGPTGPHHTDEERLKSAADIIAAARSEDRKAQDGAGEDVEALIREVAQDYLSEAEEAHGHCGTTPFDGTLEEYLPDARAFVMRCRAAHPAPVQSGLPSVEEVARLRGRLGYIRAEADRIASENKLPEEFTREAWAGVRTLMDDADALLSLIGQAQAPAPASSELVEALKGFDDDYMTSEAHHPGYVLIPTAKFEAIRQALSANSVEGG